MLMSAAEAVRGNVAVQLMLSGFAFENVIKAIMVTRGVPPLKNGELATEYKGGHNLVQLAHNLGKPLADEILMLKWLSTFAIWAGRYPISVKEEDPTKWKIEWQVTASAWWEHRVDEVFAKGWILMPDGTRSGPPLKLWRRSDVPRFPLVELGPRKKLT